MAKELVAKAVDFRFGELALFARNGADVRAHLSDDQIRWLIPVFVEHLAKKEAA